MASITSTPTSTAISHPAVALLSRSHVHCPVSAQRHFAEKLQHKPLLLNPTAGTAPEDKRALRRHIRLRKKAYFLRKQKPKPLSAKEKRTLGVYELKKGKSKGDGEVGGQGEEIKYPIYQGLNHLWNGYMLEILGYSPSTTQSTSSAKKSITPASAGSLLASADFHGADLEVVRCNDVTKVGTKGIVVRDTKYTFVLVTPRDEVKTVMKKGAVFRYAVTPPVLDTKDRAEGQESKEERKVVFELHGSQFEYRSAERANRKFKWRVMDDL